MADSCFQDHGFHLEEQVEIDQPRLQERQRKHVARMHGAVLRLSRADKLRTASSVLAGLSGGRHAINYDASGGHPTHAKTASATLRLALGPFSHRLARAKQATRETERDEVGTFFSASSYVLQVVSARKA
jgi:hypothetical protein